MIEIRHSDMISSVEIQKAYDFIYAERGISRRTSFFLWMLDILKPEAGKLLVDISCGQGQLVKLAYTKGIKAIGLDFSKVGVRIGKNSTPSAGWLVSDGEKIALRDGCADYITHIGSLEHYQSIEAGIQEISRLLKSDGTALVLLPNSFSLLGNFLYVARKGVVFDDGQPLQRYNTLGGWRSLLENYGLKVNKTIKYERTWPRTSSDWAWHLKRPVKFLRLFANFFIPLTLANCFIFLCSRKQD